MVTSYIGSNLLSRWADNKWMVLKFTQIGPNNINKILNLDYLALLTTKSLACPTIKSIIGGIVIELIPFPKAYIYILYIYIYIYIY